MQKYDVIVIGAGVIGLSSAWRLLQLGLRVLVLDKGQAGEEASSAAAGMLGAQSETHASGPFYDLLLQSRALYPEFSEEILSETGIDIELNHNGIVQTASTVEQADFLMKKAAWQQASGQRAQWLEPREVSELEPMLQSEFGALWLPDDGNIYAPRLVQALKALVHAAGCLLEGTCVYQVLSGRGEVRVRTSAGDFLGGRAVVASGAWAQSLLTELGEFHRIYPIKGQLLSVRSAAASQLAPTVFGKRVYLVPKRNGSIVIGATEEPEAGFSKTVTAGGIGTLLSAAIEVLPTLRDAQLVAMWSGLRPACSGGTPIIGAIPDKEEVILAVGHHRNGILLTPITAKLVTDAVTKNITAPVQGKAF